MAGNPVIGSPLFWLVLAVLFAGVTTVTAASSLEDHDSFCASCHMQPEDTYDQRAQLVLSIKSVPSDLASQHYLASIDHPGSPGFRCIDCHRGDQQLGDRATALTIGASDLITYFLGTPNQAIEKGSVGSPQVINNSCIACHMDTALLVGFQNHFHNKLPAAYIAWHRGAALVLPSRNPERYQKDLEAGLTLIDVDINCIDCHKAHVTATGPNVAGFFDLKADIYPVCEKCHVVAVGRELGLGLDEEP